jgi:hypothetical protein
MASSWRPAPSATAISVPLTVRLDPDRERCLQELQQESGLDRSSLIRQLIHDRWHQRQPPVTVTARLGGHPAAIRSLDSDCDVYRRFRRQPFQRVPLRE